jgi:hypothetical protein
MVQRTAETTDRAHDAPLPPDKVIVTDLLAARPSKSANHAGESAAMLKLVQALASDPASVAQRLVDIARSLTGAASAGMSVVESSDSEREIFRWIATAGEYERYVKGTMPRHFSRVARC